MEGNGGQEMKLGFKGKSPGNEVGKMRDPENEAGPSNIFQVTLSGKYSENCGNAC